MEGQRRRETFKHQSKSSIINHQSSIDVHYRDPFAGGNALAVRRDNDVAICARGGGDVSRSLPGNQLDLGMFEFAGEDRGEKTLEAGLDADFSRQPCMKEWQLAWRLPR